MRKFIPYSPDPYILTDYQFATAHIISREVAGRSYRHDPIDPTKQTVVMLYCGQSLGTNIMPTLVTMANPTKIDHINIYDGAIRDCNGPLFGTDYANNPPYFGPGHIGVIVADKLISGGQADRVIITPVSVGGTPVSYWGVPGQVYYERTNVAMKRLAARGIIPGMAGVKFICVWSQGEADGGAAQSVYMQELQGFIDKTTASGFVGTFFICQETYAFGVLHPQLRAAQLAICNGVNVLTAGDLDTVGAWGRPVDDVHPGDAGGAAMGQIIYNNIALSGVL